MDNDLSQEVERLTAQLYKLRGIEAEAIALATHNDQLRHERDNAIRLVNEYRDVIDAERASLYVLRERLVDLIEEWQNDPVDARYGQCLIEVLS